MSSGYYMACVDCEIGIYLSKPISISYCAGSVNTFGFAELGGDGAQDWEPSPTGTALLQHFLMLHRGHEIRVLSQHTDRFTGEVDFPKNVYDIDETEESELNFLRLDVGIPDPYSEPETYPESLIEKLR